MMYKYEYETVCCEFGGWGFGSGNVYGIEDYRSITTKEHPRAGDMWATFRQSSAERDILKSWI